MTEIDVVAAVLLVIGGLDGGLWGLFEFDLIAELLGGSTAAPAKLVYVLVGIAAAYQAVSSKAIRRRWSLDGHPAPARA